MSEMAHPAVHEAPTGFIRKWVFSLDHKIIGIQYYFLALFSAFLGMILSVIFRLRLAAHRDLAITGKIFGFQGGPFTRVLSLDGNDARHHHGFNGVDHGAAKTL
jgi:hypothetical protein